MDAPVAILLWYFPNRSTISLSMGFDERGVGTGMFPSFPRFRSFHRFMGAPVANVVLLLYSGSTIFYSSLGLMRKGSDRKASLASKASVAPIGLWMLRYREIPSIRKQHKHTSSVTFLKIRKSRFNWVLIRKCGSFVESLVCNYRRVPRKKACSAKWHH